MSQIYFILEWHSTCFGRSFRPSSGVKDCTYCNRHMLNRYCCLLASKQDTTVCLLASSQQYLFDKCLLLYVQSLTPDDGRKHRPKHVECYSNKINLKHSCIWLVLLWKQCNKLRITVHDIYQLPTSLDIVVPQLEMWKEQSNTGVWILQFYYFNDTIEDDKRLDRRVELFYFFSNKLPDDGTLVPKHGTCHERYFMVCILLYLLSAFFGWNFELKAQY